MLEELRRQMAELIEQRSSALEALEAVAAPAATEERSLTPEEDAAFVEARGAVQGIDTEIESLEERIAPLAEIEERTKRLSNVAPFQVNSGKTKENPYEGEVRSYTPRAELRGRVEKALEIERGLNDAEKEQALRLVEDVDAGDQENAVARRMLITGHAEYRSAWGKVMAGDMHSLTQGEQRALAAERAASLSDAAGGYAIPYTIDPTIIDTRAGVVNPMRSLATVKRISTNKWTGVSSAGVTASWDGEATQVSDDTPTLAQPEITAHKAQVFVPYSIEVGQDWAGMESEIRTMFANSKEDLEAAAHFVGTGSGQPKGIVTALDGSASEVAPDTAETFAEVDLYALETALPARYRSRARFTANKAIYQLVRQFANSDGPDLWVRLAGGQPAELIGYPALEASAMDAGFDPSADADNFLAILGDFSEYYIVDRVGMSVEMVPHLFGANGRPTGQRGVYAYWRTGGDTVNIDAFRMLNVATAS